MDEQRLQDALRAGPPDAPKHRPGALARALEERERETATSTTFRVTLRPSPTPALFAVLAVVVVAILIAGLIAQDRAPAASPPPSPIASPSSSTAAGPTPTPSGTDATSTPQAPGAPVELVDRWLGPIRPIADLSSGVDRATLDIQGSSLRFDAGRGQRDVFPSAVTPAGENTIRLTAIMPKGGCEPFDAGTYRWSLSPGRTTLRLDVIADECAARAAALVGAWTHTACRDQVQDCLGVVEAGTYASNDFDPFATGHGRQLTYTVPDGWANTIDYPTNYFLRPADEYLADPAFDGNDTIGGIYVWGGTVAVDQRPDCVAVAASGVEVTAAAIATHWLGLPSLMVTDGGTITIDARDARLLDLELDPSFTTPCPFSNGDPFAALQMNDLGARGGVWGIGPGGGHRAILFDVAPGRVVSVWVESDDAAFGDLLARAMPIIETFRFTDPPTP